jgi:type VI secretion system protein ImpI
LDDAGAAAVALVITLDNAPAGLVERERRLERGRLTIGRTNDSDWVLPDPARYLSRQHCLLEGGDQQFWITDTSSNGVFLDAGAAPLGQGNRAPLRDGMRIALGDYVIRVRIEAGATRRAETAAGSGLFDEPGDAPAPKAPPPKAPPPPTEPAPAGGRGLFDVSWVGGAPLRSAAHPVRQVETGPGTPSDHISPEFEAFERRRAPEPPRPVAAVETPPPASKAAPPPDLPPPRSEWAGSDRRLLDAFLAGAGVAPEDVPCGDPEAQLKALGEAFYALTAGLTQLLATRTLVKREAGVERTMVSAAGNNPLKLSANEHEAVLALIRHRGPGYLEPQEAIRAAIGDLKSHELALLDGMQSALRTLLRRFDPQALERELEDASLFASLVAGGRKAMYWNLYHRRYAELAEKARSRFLGEVGVDFARAYEEKARSL